MKQSLTSFPISPLSGSPTTTKARLAADVQFTANTGEVHLPGDAKHNYVEYALTVSGDRRLFPTASGIDSTTDSSDPNATYTMYLLDANNKEVGTLFERWMFDASLGATIQYTELESRNTHKVPLRDDQVYTKMQTDNLLTGRSFATPATTTNRGIVKISVPAADPIAVDVTDPRNTDSRTPTVNTPLTITLPYDGDGSVLANRVVKVVNSLAALSQTTDTGGAIGIATGGGTNYVTVAIGGRASVPATSGFSVGHYLVQSDIQDGKVMSAGTTFPSSGQVIGRAANSNFDSIALVDIFGSEVRASGTNPPAGALYWAINYPSFADAVTAMGTTVPVRLIVSEQMAVAADVTVTPNIQLQFVGNGRLIVATNKTVTIQGSLIASPSQWIFDVSASGAVVSFSGNNFVTAYYPQWYGVTGDGATDDTTALQAFTDQIPATSAHSIFTRGLVIKITSTWKIWGKYSWLLESATVLGNGSSDARQVPTIRWAGADGGVVIDISKTRDSTFRGLYVDMNGNGGSTHGADTGIWLNQLNSNVGDICTSNIFEYININASSQRPNITVLEIGDSTNSNVEFMQFNYCVFSGNTNPNIDSGVFGASRLIFMHTQNTLAHKFRKTTWNRAHIGIDCQYGSFSSEGGEGGVLEIAYRVGNLIGPSRIVDDRLEGVRQIISTIGSGGSDRSLTCITNDWPSLGVVGAGTAAYPFIDWSLAGSAPLILIGNFIGDFRGYLPGGVPVNNYLVTDVFKGTATGPASEFSPGGNVLTAIGNVTYGVDSYVLLKNYATFYQASVDGRAFTNNSAHGLSWTNSLDFITSTGLQRRGIGQAGNGTDFDRRRIVAGNNLFLGDGQVEFLGIPMPNPPKITIVGIYGTAFYEFALVAYDAGGNRTPRSEILAIGVANATLSGANYIKLDWADIPNAAGGVDIINTVNNGDTFQLVAHVASGVTTYNVVANPAGAFTYALPAYNETMRLGLRGPVYPINIIVFTDGATTPSVKQSNTFKTANTAPTTITNFTQGVDGQQITVIMRDANTTIANGGSINIRSGADIVPAVNRSYSFVREGGVWIQVN